VEGLGGGAGQLQALGARVGLGAAAIEGIYTNIVTLSAQNC